MQSREGWSLVTGASKDIGKEFAIALAEKGKRVIIPCIVNKALVFTTKFATMKMATKIVEMLGKPIKGILKEKQV